MKHIEIVVPCFNEEACIEPLYVEVDKVMAQIPNITYSILYVNDGSKDGTLEEIRRMAKEHGNDRIRYVSFSRNFGKEAGIYAGFDRCEGDYIVLMDADLQHPPTLIPEMLKKIEEGHYDCVGARRVSRKGEPPIRSAFSKMFYYVINRVTCMSLVPGGSDYRMMTKQMVKSIITLSERERFIKGIMSWVGFDTYWLEYENVERIAGTTKWSFFGLVRYAWNGFVSFATTPLRAVMYLGMFIVLAAVIYFVKVFASSVIGSRVWTEGTTIVLLLLAIGGVIITILGVIGEYMARIYLELKQRPIYIAKETNIEEVTTIEETIKR